MGKYVFELKGYDREIRRKVELDDNITFATLHKILQVCFGWSNSHLHEFQAEDVVICNDVMDDDDFDYLNEKKIKLIEYFTDKKEIKYIYDFGSSKEVQIKLIDKSQYDMPKVIGYCGGNVDENDEEIFIKFDIDNANKALAKIRRKKSG